MDSNVYVVIFLDFFITINHWNTLNTLRVSGHFKDIILVLSFSMNKEGGGGIFHYDDVYEINL